MRRNFLQKAAAGILAASLLLTGCGAADNTANTSNAGNSANVSADAQKDDDYVVKIGYGTVLCMAPLQIAVEKGYFDEEGLKYQAIKMDGFVGEYVGSGQVDASYGMVSKLLQPIENGLNIQMTAGIHNGCLKLLVKDGSGINSVADLKGKTIGVNGLAEAPCVLVKRALSAAGIGVTNDNLEVDFVVYNASDLALALDNGAVDAICLGDPAATVAKNNYGFKVLLDNAVDKPFSDEYCCASFVTTDFATEHPELAAKYTRAVMKASAWVEANPEEAAQFLVEKEYLSGKPELLGKILDTYNCKPSVQGGYDALVSNVAEFIKLGLLDKDTNAEEFVKKSFTFLNGVEETY